MMQAMHVVHACRDSLRLGFRMSDLYWPADADEAIAGGLVQQLDGGNVRHA